MSLGHLLTFSFIF